MRSEWFIIYWISWYAVSRMNRIRGFLFFFLTEAELILRVKFEISTTSFSIIRSTCFLSYCAVQIGRKRSLHAKKNSFKTRLKTRNSRDVGEDCWESSSSKQLRTQNRVNDDYDKISEWRYHEGRCWFCITEFDTVPCCQYLLNRGTLVFSRDDRWCHQVLKMKVCMI